MRTVRLDKAELLATVQDNREKHVDEYETALVEYRADLRRELLSKVATIDEEGEKLPDPGSKLPVPKTYEEEYDQAIEMLTHSVDDTVELTGDEFAKYFLDKWEWKRHFAASTQIYNNKG